MRKAHNEMMVKAINENPEEPFQPKVKPGPGWTPERVKASDEVFLAAFKAGLAKKGVK